jgi:hypothetical protein
MGDGNRPGPRRNPIEILATDAISEFAVEYANQNERDYRAFVKAVRERHVEAKVES